MLFDLHLKNGGVIHVESLPDCCNHHSSYTGYCHLPRGLVGYSFRVAKPALKASLARRIFGSADSERPKGPDWPSIVDRTALRLSLKCTVLWSDELPGNFGDGISVANGMLYVGYGFGPGFSSVRDGGIIAYSLP